MILYRFERGNTKSFFGGYLGNVNYLELPVIKETPKGYWVKYYGEKKFVKKKGRKVFARVSKQEAYEDFIYRTKKAVKLIEDNLNRVKSYLHVKIEDCENYYHNLNI